jgi:8-oxo-dGTP diphosphatase
MRLPTRVAGIIIKDERVVLMHRNKNGQEYWVFPGGGLEDSDSSPEEGLLREIQEETTLSVKVNKLLYTHDYTSNNGLYYLCDFISGTLKLGDSVELKRMQEGKGDLYEPVWVSLANLNNLLLYPLEIRDWLTNDIKNNFADAPRQQKLNIKDLRKV